MRGPGRGLSEPRGRRRGGASVAILQEDQFAVRAHDDLRQGDEAFASYGAKSNALLVTRRTTAGEERDNPPAAMATCLHDADTPFPCLRSGARPARTGFDETVAKAAP